MEEDISIINSNTRNERVRNFFINNKNKIISTIVVLIAIKLIRKKKSLINLTQLL